MSKLRTKMKQMMELVGHAPSTQKNYVRAAVQLQAHYPVISLHNLTYSQLQDYLHHLKKTA